MRKILLLMLLISSCTGSFEGGTSPVRLVVSLNPSVPSLIQCSNGLATTIPQKPGLAMLDLNRLTGTGSSEPCATFYPLTASPYNTINAGFDSTNNGTSNTPDVIVSLPGQATVQRFRFQSPNSLIQQSTEYKPTNGSAYCPTQLAVSSDFNTLAVLDKPNDPTANCASSGTGVPRVLVFSNINPTVSNPTTTLTSINISSAIDGIGGGISIALFNNRLYVLGTFTGQYRVARFDITANPIPVTTDSFSDFPTQNSSVNLSVVQNGIQNGVLASFSSSNTNAGRVQPILENSTPNTISFGTELQASNVPIGKTSLVRSNGSSGSSFTLFLRSTDVLFQQGTQFASANTILSPLDATFPPDNSIWILSSGRLSKTDTRNFPQSLQFDIGIDLTGLNPGNLVWMFNPNQI